MHNANISYCIKTVAEKPWPLQRLGFLDRNDQFYGWLVGSIFPQLGVSDCNSPIQVYRLRASHEVYVYELWVNGSRIRVVGKFFGNDSVASEEVKNLRLGLEVRNIGLLRGLGFDQGDYRVVRLLGYNPQINYVLVEEYVSGSTLDRLIKKAIFDGWMGELYKGLEYMADFLNLLHSKVQDGERVDFGRECEYFRKTLSRVAGQLSVDDTRRFNILLDRWIERREMWSSDQVLVHGDCSPTNFFVSSSPKLVAVDLESCRKSDAALDTGRVAAELRHHFMMMAGDGWRAEPLIRHFYKRYCEGFWGHPDLFREITLRSPFYQGLAELMIAKNWWLSYDYRRLLIKEAIKCLS